MYVEDRAADADIFEDLLKGKEVHVTTVEPPITLDIDGIVNKRPDLILLDYELNRRLSSGKHASYQGGTLAAKLREKFADYPILLFTTKTVLRDYDWPTEELGAIDEILYKDDLRRERSQNVLKIIGIANGFATLRGASHRDWTTLVKLLGANSAEAELLRDTSPPLDLKAEDKKVGWSVRQASGWVLKTLLMYPGILYDSVHAASSLGIDEKSFRSNKFQKRFVGTRYEGPFSDIQEWWWRHKLHEKAFAFIKTAKMQPILAESFSNAFERVTSQSIKRSRCITCGKLGADSVCYVLNKPVHKSCSLEYYPDKRLPVMDVARVSFRAIREDNRFQSELLGDEDKKLVSKILRDGKV